MELTLTLLSVFKNQQPQTLHSDNWEKALQTYRGFMQDFHESMKNGRIYPREELVAQKTSEVYLVAQKNPLVQQQLQRLGVSREMLSVAIAMVLQTKTWQSFPNQRKESTDHASILRWYNSAKTYRPIYPVQ